MISRILDSRTGRIVTASVATGAIALSIFGASTIASAHENRGRGWGEGVSQSVNRMSATTAPVIAGTGAVGQVLTVSTPAVWNQTPDSVTYQWFAGGHAIAGATGTSFTITNEQAGRKISVMEKAVKAGYVAKPSASNRITVAELSRFEELQDVTISGSTTIGSTLTVSAGIYTPAPQSISYQWQRDGVAIDGATGTSYVVSADDAGKRINVVETVSATDYKTKSQKSNRLWIPVAG